MKSLILICSTTLLFSCCCFDLLGQKKKILIDVAHGQKFYSDPADKISTELVPTKRLEYMTGELTKNAEAHKGEIKYLKTAITPEALSNVNLLFIHVPSIKFTADECKAIQQYLKKGGALFIAIEEDYWATLDQVNPNDILMPFGINFSSNNPDTSVGGHTTESKVTKQKYSIPFHGARLVEGGTSFAVSNGSAPTSFAVFTEVKGGGKIIAMGEAMVSLYMTSWQNVSNYECAPFMGDAIGWLLN